MSAHTSSDRGGHALASANVLPWADSPQVTESQEDEIIGPTGRWSNTAGEGHSGSPHEHRHPYLSFRSQGHREGFAECGWTGGPRPGVDRVYQSGRRKELARP